MIDISFDFTTDSKGYWDGFWDKGDGLGACGADPCNGVRFLFDGVHIILPNDDRIEFVWDYARMSTYYITVLLNNYRRAVDGKIWI